MSAVAQTDALPAAHAARKPAEHGLASRPWAWAFALAGPLTLAYLIWSPPAADLAAAIYRSDLFAKASYVLRDNGWYAGHAHYVIGYSLLSPPLGALLGVRLTMALSVLAACVLFGLIARRMFGPAAGTAAALVFAFGLCAELLSGRVPYDVGVALGLGSALALMSGRPVVALVLALLTSVASPVAGAFLALACLAWALAVATVRPDSNRSWRWPLAIAATALAPPTALSIAFPEGGHEPFAPSSFWPAFVAIAALGLLLPRASLTARVHRGLRIGAGLYALALLAAFVIETPMGGNAARLGPELAPALMTGALWQHRRLALGLLAPALLYWQLNTPVTDLTAIYGQESVAASYYTPLLGELRTLDRRAPTIIEIPLTAAHMEAAYVAGHDGVRLARGWDRQLDTRYGALFYRGTLTTGAYRAWLHENHVAYVALPDAKPDYSALSEVALVESALPYLHEIWRSAHWRLLRVIG